MASTTTDTADLPHDNIQPQAIALIFIFPVLATIALALRIYSQSLTRTFASDDWTILIAGAVYWAFTYASYKVIKVMHIGYHVWDIPVDFDFELGQKYGYASELLYSPILALVKQSVLLYLLRLTGQKTNVKMTIWGLLIFNAIVTIATFVMIVFHSIPIAASWKPEANFANFVTATASVAILTVVVGIIRVVLLDHFDRNITTDPNYSVLFCISTIEVGLSFIVACAPPMKPIVKKILPKLLGNSSRARIRCRNGGSMLAYHSDQRSRQTHSGTNRTKIGAGGDDDSTHSSDLPAQGKNGIAVMTETEGRWF